MELRVKILVDADACPVVIRQILFKASERTQTQLVLVANQLINVPKSKFIQSIRVESGFDVADDRIVEMVEAEDLVITSDLPLANDVIEKAAVALSPRGELFTKENIKSRLNMRDFLDTMRASGVHTGGPAPLSQSDRQAFGNALDRILAKFNKLK